MRELTLRQRIEGMSLAYDPDAAPDLAATIQFVISGEEPGRYHLKLSDGQATFHLGETQLPNLTIYAPARIWRSIIDGQTTGAEALAAGAYRAEGDASLLMRMSTLFRPAEGLMLEARRRPRGPLPIDGMVYMHLIFAAWIFHLFSFNWPSPDKFLSYAIAFGVTASVAVYRLVFNRPTILDLCSAVYFGLALLAYPPNAAFLNHWGSALSLTVMSAMWLIGMAGRDEPLSAHYSKWHFVPAMERYSGFRQTNFVISLFWGVVILIQLVARQISNLDHALHYPMLAIELGVLVPAVFFTMNYPKKAAERRIENPEASERSFRTAARALLVVLAAVFFGVVALAS